MNRSELVQKKAKEWDFTQAHTRKLIDHFVDSLDVILKKHGRLELRNFGVFELKQRVAKQVTLPDNSEKTEIPGQTVPTFTAGKKFNELVNRDD